MLYHPSQAKSSCGFGLIANMCNQPKHEIIQKAIAALVRLTHRGAISADGLTGDGCGILMTLPDSFFKEKASELKIRLANQYAVGMFFFPTDEQKYNHAKLLIERTLNQYGLSVAGWRDVPNNPELLGEQAKKTRPIIEQIFINKPEQERLDHFNRTLFIARQVIRYNLANEPEFYICSLSTSTIIYKGLMMPKNLAEFYPDLADPNMKTTLAIFHQRFSTNTEPKWRLAQPFRLLAHNGEINTINANRSWALSRLAKTLGEKFPELIGMRTLVNQVGSDSSSLDNMLELLTNADMDVRRAIRLLIPPAWQNVEHMDPDLRAFYEYNSMHMEPWDGPAGIVLTDGRLAGCTLDRNGLRPARYIITNQNELIIASENGTCDIEEKNVIQKGRIKAGELLMLDLHTGELQLPNQIDKELKSRAPYQKWLLNHTTRLQSVFQQDIPVVKNMSKSTLTCYQKLFNVSFEERQQVIKPMATEGQESIGSMGDDTPMAILSHNNRPLYDYFRQLFAQVTNPPIDPLRETMVMSLQNCLGAEYSMFQESQSQASRIVIDTPILNEGTYLGLLKLGDSSEKYKNKVINLNYDPSISLEQALQKMCQEAVDAIHKGHTILILSDQEISETKIPIHALLATGYLHQHLIEHDLRAMANLILVTATARDPHHMACLLGSGATLIYPYLAYEIIADQLNQGLAQATPSVALKNYQNSIDKGLYKIMSKMGISTMTSYRGSQLFEIIGLSEKVTQKAFPEMANRTSGIGFTELENEQLKLHQLAFDQSKSIKAGGILKYMNKGEAHAYHPDVVQNLQQAVSSGHYEDYKKYRDIINDRTPMSFRDLLKLDDQQSPISVDLVEPVEQIYKRFDSAAMSLGALSPEAHETLAMAMNELGGRSNSGEGGEDENRFNTNKVSKIKQIASGRFGVTPHYLVNAEVLQIKVAQGAKPGEGGQLPGHKVNQLIAELRYSKPGVTLISPPPHHDIYSIEDLAQLIFDLKQVNPDALISVKLVSAPGVGTIATGVAKCYADMITISGNDGGTGASPQTSIRYAGSPWELGLSETHQALCENNLRDKILLQTDGGLKTGLDVVKAAILGAETFGFGTGPMIAMGCKYLRICHLNNCATGLATQHSILRQNHFLGTKEKVKNYFYFIAEEVREILAALGKTSLEQIIGQTDLLKVIESQNPRYNQLNLDKMLSKSAHFNQKMIKNKNPNTPFDSGLKNKEIKEMAEKAIINAENFEASCNIQNIDRSVGASLSGLIAKHHGKTGLKKANIKFRFTGTSGQSFGVWNAPGLNLYLQGEANDYAGKGMAGGKIVIKPHPEASFDFHHSPIAGNTCLYGATGGVFMAAGQVGERFAVRNSGVIAITEGAGNHCCEYMTGGAVVILGDVGVNFGAGMTGGLAFVLDQDNLFHDRCNTSSVDIHRITSSAMIEHNLYLKELITQFAKETDSHFAKEILANFNQYASCFWLVKPKTDALHDLIHLHMEAA